MAHYSAVSGPAPGGVSSPAGSGGEAFVGRRVVRDLAGAETGVFASGAVFAAAALGVAFVVVGSAADGFAGGLAVVALAAEDLVAALAVVALAGDFRAVAAAGLRVVEVFRAEVAVFLAARAGFAAAEPLTASVPVALAESPLRAALAACFSRYSALVGQYGSRHNIHGLRPPKTLIFGVPHWAQISPVPMMSPLWGKG